MTTTPAGTRFLSLTQVETELNIGLAQTYALVRSGELQGIQIGGRNQWRVERTKLEEYIQHAYERARETWANSRRTIRENEPRAVSWKMATVGVVSLALEMKLCGRGYPRN